MTVEYNVYTQNTEAIQFPNKRSENIYSLTFYNFS